MVRKRANLWFAALITFVFAITLVIVNTADLSVSADGEDFGIAPDAVSIINGNSRAVNPWVDSTTPEYANNSFEYDATNGASFGLSGNLSSKVVYSGAVGDKTVLRFTADFSTAGSDYTWNYVIFRGDENLGDFTALAFRKGGGHMILVSRVSGNWYTYETTSGNPGDVIFAGYPTIKNCDLGSSSDLASISDGTAEMTIVSSRYEAEVYLNTTSGWKLIYSSELKYVNPSSNSAVIDGLPSATGILAIPDGNPNLTLSNLKCYSINEFVGPDDINTSEMKTVISADSKATNPWKDSTTPEYTDTDFTYDSVADTASFAMAKNSYLITQLSYQGAYFSETVLRFTADFSTADSDYTWNYVVFRGNDKLGDFTAFAFRKALGHMMMVSRVNNKWYTYETTSGNPGDAIFAGYPTIKNCDIVSSPVLASRTGNLVNMTIHSTSDYVTVYANKEKIYESELTLHLQPAMGILGFGGISGNPNLKLTNLQCYVEDYKLWNNAVNENSIVYSPYGGGGAQSTLSADGATLSAGSSIDGTAAFTMPEIKGRTVVQTYSFTLENENIWDEWYSVLVRANADMSEYLVFQIRRGVGTCAMYGKIGGYNCTYAINEPFADKNICIFPLTFLNGAATLDKGTKINLTIVSDDYGCTVYESGQTIYSVDYRNMKFEDPNIVDVESYMYGLDLDDFQGYVAALSPATGMFGGNKGYAGAEYSAINCYYSGEEVADVQKQTFLTGITYGGKALEGFASGSFEYDITIGTADTPNRGALEVFAGSGVNGDTVDISWRTEDKFGYEQAVITMKAGADDKITRTYIITFEKYDSPKPFVREVWGTDSALPV